MSPTDTYDTYINEKKEDCPKRNLTSMGKFLLFKTIVSINHLYLDAMQKRHFSLKGEYKMKYKAFAIIMLCCCFLFAGGCAYEEDHGNQDNNMLAQEHIADEDENKKMEISPNDFKECFELCEKDQFYELYVHNNGFATYYRILDEDSVIIDSGYHDNNIRISYNDDLLELSYGAGTFVRFVRYYDVHNGCVSRFFSSSLLVKNGRNVAYPDGHMLVVQNIFDPAVYYQEFELDPKPISAVDFEAEFIDSQHIKVTYPISYEETVSKIFTLSSQ